MNIEWPIEIIELILEHSDGGELSHHDKNSRSFLVDENGRSRWGLNQYSVISISINARESWRSLVKSKIERSLKEIIFRTYFSQNHRQNGFYSYNMSHIWKLRKWFDCLNRNFNQHLAIRLWNKTLEDNRSGLEPFLNEWIHAGLQD